jgi:uncharacterized membrane protein YczE
MGCYPFSGMINGLILPSSGLIMGHSPFNSVIMGCSPTSGLSVGFTSTVFNSSPVMLSPLKIAECLYYGVSPSLILPVLFCFVKFTCHIQSYIRTFIHIFMHKNIQARITCIQISFIHDYIDHIVSYFNCISQKRHP